MQLHFLNKKTLKSIDKKQNFINHIYFNCISRPQNYVESPISKTKYLGFNF